MADQAEPRSLPQNPKLARGTSRQSPVASRQSPDEACSILPLQALPSSAPSLLAEEPDR